MSEHAGKVDANMLDMLREQEGDENPSDMEEQGNFIL